MLRERVFATETSVSESENLGRVKRLLGLLAQTSMGLVDFPKVSLIQAQPNWNGVYIKKRACVAEYRWCSWVRPRRNAEPIKIDISLHGACRRYREMMVFCFFSLACNCQCPLSNACQYWFFSFSPFVFFNFYFGCLLKTTFMGFNFLLLVSNKTLWISNFHWIQVSFIAASRFHHGSWFSSTQVAVRWSSWKIR